MPTLIRAVLRARPACLAAVAAAALLLTLTACVQQAPPPPAPATEATSTPSPTPTPIRATPATTPTPSPTPTPEPRTAVALHISDDAERGRVEAALNGAPRYPVGNGTRYVVVDDPDAAELAIADEELADTRARFVLARWVAVTDQRRDVLGLRRGDVLDILHGDARDWSAFGGSPQPIAVYLPASQAAAIADALGEPGRPLAAIVLPDDEVHERVATTPGAFALIAPEEMRLGLLALTLDGYDPYRDFAAVSPLQLARWVRAPTPEEATALAAAAGIVTAPVFDPVGMLVTGELLPVRCSNFVLDHLDDYGAMFDRVRQATTAAEITVSSLETSLTDLGKPTPCRETYVLQGSPRVVDAIAEAGIDVVLPIGNHIGDCWGGCPAGLVLLDTLERLHGAGIATAGAGEHLAAARAPAVVAVDVVAIDPVGGPVRRPVRFAFLGYDSMAPWYHATQVAPGTAPLDAASLREDVRAALEVADHVVVGANWGIEYKSDPNAFQREMAGIAIDAGAALVIGNHPHWVQAVEHFDGALVSYAGGNFVFDQDWSDETAQGLVIELGFTAERLLGYRIRPVVIRGDGGDYHWIYRPEFVDPAGEGRPILDRIWEAQDRLPAR